MLKFLLISAVVIFLIGYTLCCRKAKQLNKQGFTDMNCLKCLNPKKWFSVAVGFIFSKVIPDHIFEQYVIRFYDSYCRNNCLLSESGNCTVCGCDARAKMMSPYERCSKNLWGEIVFSKSEYESIRKKYPLTIKIEYEKQF